VTVSRIQLIFDYAALAVAVDSDSTRSGRPDLWPSIGEYPCYDPFLYRAMNRDNVRNRAFERSLRRLAPGRSVLDLGTGQDLTWALVAAAVGARQVIAVEAMPESYAKARARLAIHPASDRVELLHGLSTELGIDGSADVCVSEIIGSIASSEGIIAVITDARRRLLTPDAVVVPDRCTTEVGAICLRDIFPGGLALSSDSVPYLAEIFELTGGPFDVRLAIANLPADAVVSTVDTVETILLNGALREDEVAEVRLRMRREARVDGLLCWITVAADADGEVIDTLQQRTSWIPVYLPLFDEPVLARAGDVLDVCFERQLGDDGVHPDYRVTGRLHTADAEVASTMVSRHHGGGLGGTRVHQEIFEPWGL
jgi:protein arginine N-methyltransferase 1